MSDSREPVTGSRQEWIEIACVIDGSLQQTASDILEAHGAVSVTLGDAADEPLLEPAPGEQPVWQQVRIAGLFRAGTDAAAITQALREGLGIPQLACSSEPLADRDWSSTWRDSFHAMRFGERLWICPSGERVDEEGAVVIDLDPGLAFGTGTHATTALCLEWLDRQLVPGSRVIDYGCGSGILAIAACKLGAARVHAVDIDPQALQATRVNAEANGVIDCCRVSLPAALASDPVELLLANILANPLIELSKRLSGLVSSGGRIVLTGILAEQADAVMAAYEPYFSFREPVCREQWVLLAGEKS